MLLKPLLVIYAVIACFSLASFIVPALRKPERKPLRQAINSWWPPALVGGAAVMSGPQGAALVFAGVSAWALAEQLRLTAARQEGVSLSWCAAVAVALHYVTILALGADATAAPLLLWSAALAPLCVAWRHGPQAGADAAQRLTLGAALSCWALGHIPMLCALPTPTIPAGGAGAAMWVMLCVMTNDAAQFVCGKLFGRRALIPSISPKKTWEGLVGGACITAAVGAVSAPAITGIAAPAGALLGAALSLCGVLGDLLVSVLKREAGVKDSGAVLPGQGGVLDRVDSLLLCAPLSLYVVKLWSSPPPLPLP